MKLGYGATASSPKTAERMQYFKPGHDVEVMNRDRLYTRSVQELSALAENYTPKSQPEFKLAGGDILERMAAFMDEGVAKGDFFPHDKTVAMQIASIMCSDDGVEQDATEQDLYKRERDAFIRLAKTPETRARIYGLLHGGGAVRN